MATIQTKRLRTLAKNAQANGLITTLERTQLRVNPQTGTVLRGQGRNILMIYTPTGDTLVSHDANCCSSRNSSVESALAKYTASRSTTPHHEMNQNPSQNNEGSPS